MSISNIKGAFHDDPYLKSTGYSKEFLTEIGLELIAESREAAKESDHHRYHVGSALASVTHDHQKTIISNANKIPDQLKEKGFDSHTKIGDGSPTTHSEPTLLMEAEADAAFTGLGCNTPFCASCMKSAIVRGVDVLFVDASSLPASSTDGQSEENPWTNDRLDLWDSLILPTAKQAKMPIIPVDLEKGTIHLPLVDCAPASQRPKPEFPAHILQKNDIFQLQNNPDLFLAQSRVRSVIGVAENKDGEELLIYAQDSYPPGFSSHKKKHRQMEERFKDSHYHFPLDPIIHLCMKASRHDLEVKEVLTNFLPTSGRQLDLAGMGIDRIFLSKNNLMASEDSLKAMEQLKEHGIIDYHAVKANKKILSMIDNSFKTSKDYNSFECTNE